MTQIIVPSFDAWRDKPQLWFVQVEAIFEINNVRSDHHKYNHIIAALDKNLLVMVSDVLIKCNKEDYRNNKYDHLKNEILRRLSISVLRKIEMASRTPSQFYDFLDTIASPLVPKDTVKAIWFQGLPNEIVDIISTIRSSGNIKILKEMADKIYKIVSAKSQPLANNVPENLAQLLEELSTQLGKMQMQLKKIQVEVYGAKTSNANLKAICQNCELVENLEEVFENEEDNGSENEEEIEPEPEEKEPVFCHYHKTYGSNAFRCSAPCDYLKYKGSDAKLI